MYVYHLLIHISTLAVCVRMFGISACLVVFMVNQSICLLGYRTCCNSQNWQKVSNASHDLSSTALCSAMSALSDFPSMK